ADGFLVAFGRGLVLLFARDGVFFGDQFAGHAHVKVFLRVPQAVVDHRVHEFPVTDAVAGARLRQQIRAVGHGLHAARDNDFGFAQLHGLRRQRYGFQSGTANWTDRHRRSPLVTSRLAPLTRPTV